MTQDDEKGGHLTIGVGSGIQAYPWGKIRIADEAPPGDVVFVADKKRGEILRFKPDGTVVAGPGWALDNAAATAFLEVLSQCVPGWMAALRQRAEKAEAEVRALNFERIDGLIPTRQAFGKLGGMLTKFAARNRLTFDQYAFGWRMQVRPVDPSSPPYTRIEAAPGAGRGMMAEDLGLGP